MNAFQRSAILIIRLAGVAMLVIAAMGLLHYFYKSALGGSADSDGARAEASVLWFIFGFGLVAFSRPLGAWLGRDLG